MTVLNDAHDLYYDPFDIEIDKDPHPIWRRMRDEAPLWFNERHDFWALSRFDDVEAAMKDWDTYRSGKGSTLDFIKSGMELPPGNILMEDPPSHDVHRGLMSRVFTPKRMNALEDKVRAFCARSLDPLVGTRSVRLRAGPRRADADAHDRHAPRHPRAGPGGDPRPPRREPRDPRGGCVRRGRGGVPR